MPELPEAETARRRIDGGALNRTITGIRLGEVSHMDLPDKNAREALVGHQFSRTHRHGKYIFAGSKSGPWIAIHLGMAGSLRVMQEGEERPDYIRLTVAFEGGTELTFRDPRKFGWIRVVDDPEDMIAEKGLGPDALEIGDNAFASAVGGTNGAVKPALLNQKKLAGIGNLWADEALFQTGILPDARASALGSDRIADLHAASRRILRTVVETGARYAELPGDWIIHHRKEGADCPRCDGTIRVRKVGGRSSYHCPHHQEGA